MNKIFLFHQCAVVLTSVLLGYIVVYDIFIVVHICTQSSLPEVRDFKAGLRFVGSDSKRTIDQSLYFYNIAGFELRLLGRFTV